MIKMRYQFQQDIEEMNVFVDWIIVEWRENLDENLFDFLVLMFEVKDFVMGERLDDENICY